MSLFIFYNFWWVAQYSMFFSLDFGYAKKRWHTILQENIIILKGNRSIENLQIVHFQLSPGNIADNNHSLLKSIAEKLQCFLFGDKGYISVLAADLKAKGLHLFTKLRKNMTKKQHLGSRK